MPAHLNDDQKKFAESVLGRADSKDARDCHPSIEARDDRPTELVGKHQEVVHNLLGDAMMETIKSRPTADVVADILDLDPKRSQQLLDALNNSNENVVNSAKSAIKISYRENGAKQALVEFAKALAVDRAAESVAKLWAEHKAIMSGESKTGCRHLADAQYGLEMTVQKMADALDKRLALIEQKVLIYAAIALFILTPVTSALTAALFAYLSRK